MPEPLRVAVIGGGPAGIYAADILRKSLQGDAVMVDLFERLPAPYGLVRYGVAPDHPRIRGIITALREVLDRRDIRIFANVNFGSDIFLADLKRLYHAVIFATGAVRDAALRIPGVELAGSFGASDFVSWYDGHPDVPRDWDLSAESVAVIGNGNVALDVARMLAKPLSDLKTTEIPANVAARLADARTRDVHIFGRRGPMQVKFTPLELRELGELNDVEMVVYDEDFAYDSAARAAVTASKQLQVVDRVFQSWLGRDHSSTRRRLHLHFYARPVEIKDAGGGRVGAIRYERMAPDGDGGVRGTGEMREIGVEAVYRSVGYFGSPLADVPFDEQLGVIPNVEGRVVGADGKPLAGMYATGWIKRGPVGLIGHTKSDAMETIRHLLEDRDRWWTPDAWGDEGATLERDAAPAPGPRNPVGDPVIELLTRRGVRWTNLDGWHRLDARELALGTSDGRERVKVVPRDEMLAIARGES